MQVQKQEVLQHLGSQSSTNGDVEEQKDESDSDDCTSVVSHQSRASCVSSRVAEGSRVIKKDNKRRKKKRVPLKQSGVPGSQVTDTEV